MSLDALQIDAAQLADRLGVCQFCGSLTDPVEAGASGITCDACGYPGVIGAEVALVCGLFVMECSA